MGKRKEKVIDPALLEKIKSVVVENTDEAFHIKMASDDCSSHIACYANRKEDGQSSWKNLLPNSIDGWRVLTIDVPHGYVETFFK